MSSPCPSVPSPYPSRTETLVSLILTISIWASFWRKQRALAHDTAARLFNRTTRTFPLVDIGSRAVYFLKKVSPFLPFQPKTRPSVVAEHLNICIYSAVLVCHMAFIGAAITVNVILGCESLYILLIQTGFIFGIERDGLAPLKQYRHKPRFGVPVLLQLICSCILILVSFFRCWSFRMTLICRALFAILPTLCNANLVLFLMSGPEPDYLLGQNSFLGVVPAATFCHVCESVLKSINLPEVFVTHHKTVQSLLLSARQGCRICAAVWQYRTLIPQDVFGSLMFWKPVTSIKFIDEYGCYVKSEQSRDEVQNLCSFKLLEAEPAEKHVALDDLSDDTGSLQSMLTASSWLKNCLEKHPQCKAYEESTFSPSRLIYLGSGNVSSDIRLHCREDRYSSVSYMTLSHCWGGKQNIQLLQANLEDFRCSIPLFLLPKTFQDAITIVRNLGSTYLWIDSLCIIQDSPEDWNQESSQMGTVYRNSLCNIAASDAPNGLKGILYPRAIHTIQPTKIPRQDQAGLSLVRYLVNGKDIYNTHPLYKRAWVLQEFLLARRSLSCGTAQLFWHCGTLHASEVYPGGFPASNVESDHPATAFQSLSPLSEKNILSASAILQRLKSNIPHLRHLKNSSQGRTSIKREHGQPWADWVSILMAYSGMELTKPQDRAVALAGVIELFAPYFGQHRYGIWCAFLPFELLWTTATPAHAYRPSPARAPSWSWLAVECALTWDWYEFDTTVDMMLARVDNFGPAEKIGEDELQGRMNVRELSVIGKISCWAWMEGPNPNQNPLLVDSFARQRERDDEWGYLPWRPRGEVRFDVLERNEGINEVFCLPVKSVRGNLHQEGTYGLVLKAMEGGWYRRIGAFRDIDHCCADEMLRVQEGIIRLV